MEIVVLAQPDCSWCEDARELIGRVAQEQPIVLRVIDISSDEGSAMAASAGVLFPPGVFLDGQLVSYGRLSERRLRRDMERRSRFTAE